LRPLAPLRGLCAFDLRALTNSGSVVAAVPGLGGLFIGK
jgi:hypothetical protein